MAYGLTQDQLATALGMTRRGVVFIEAGDRQPNVRTIGAFRNLAAKYLVEKGAKHGI